MKLSIGNYEIEVPNKDNNFQPLEQNNASSERTVIDGNDITVGFVYNAVYKQKRALEYGLEQSETFTLTQKYTLFLTVDMTIHIFKINMII